MGKAQVLDLEPEEDLLPIPHSVNLDKEIRRFRAALSKAERKLHQIKNAVQKKAGERDAMIFQAQLAILRDPSAHEEVIRALREQKTTSEKAVRLLMKGFESKFRAISDPGRDWVSEVRDPWNLVLQALLLGEQKKLLGAEDRYILVTEELTPTIAMYLEKGRVIAVVSERGGKYSHGAILVRSFGIPAIAGISKATSRIRSGMTLIVNGDDGELWIEPSSEKVIEQRRRSREQAVRAQLIAHRAQEPLKSRNGDRILVEANVESLRDLDQFDLSVVDGIGLLRTEFLFRERSEFPSEDEQVEIYRQALKSLKGKPVTFRTLDIGGDKPLPMLQTPKENNPSLGWRGLRLSLQWRDLLIVQLRALLRVSEFGPVRILLPMVTNLGEVRTVRELIDSLQQDLLGVKRGVKDSVPLGIMVEVPAAAYLLPHLKDLIDFISVGTNDLTQYLLAVDRDNPWVESLYEPFHPAMIRFLDELAKTARQCNIATSICGEMAGDPEAAMLFYAMGIRSLSMVPNRVAGVKALLRLADRREMERLRTEVLGLATAEEIRQALSREARKLWDLAPGRKELGGSRARTVRAVLKKGRGR